MAPRLLIAVALLAGCGGRRGARPAEEPEPGFTAPARYAAMFEPGRTWRYTVRTTTEFADDSSGPVGDYEFSPLQLMGSLEVTCTVTDVEVGRTETTSTIVCRVDGEDPWAGLPVAGRWRADERGLSRDGDPVLAPDGTECSEGAAQQLCFAGGAVQRGWFNEGSDSSTFEQVTEAAPGAPPRR